MKRIWYRYRRENPGGEIIEEGVFGVAKAILPDIGPGAANTKERAAAKFFMRNGMKASKTNQSSYADWIKEAMGESYSEILCYSNFGRPDLSLLDSDHEIRFVEVKSSGGSFTDHQIEWIKERNEDLHIEVIWLVETDNPYNNSSSEKPSIYSKSII